MCLVVTEKLLLEWEKGEKVCAICLVQLIPRASLINYIVVMISFQCNLTLFLKSCF